MGFGYPRNMNDDPSEEKTQKPLEESQTDVLLNLENLVKSHIAGIDSRRKQLKEQRQMLDDIFTNDPTYNLHSEKAKEAARVKSQTKQQLLKQPNVAAIDEKIKALTTEIKEMDTALSDYLSEYQRMSGSNEIEGEDGEVREIVFIAKLVKRPAKIRK